MSHNRNSYLLVTRDINLFILNSSILFIISIQFLTFHLKLINYLRSIMASQTQGIQQLLAAEKRADEKVIQARKRKTLKLKRAKEEAQAEVLRFRDERERQFKEYEKQHMGSKESSAAQIEETTNNNIEAMKSTVMKNKNKVILYLIDQVFNVQAQVHENYRYQ